MTLHEPKCGCCGCKSLNILRVGPLRGVSVNASPSAWPPSKPGKSLAEWLNEDRDLGDYEPEQVSGSVSLPGQPHDGFGPTKIVSVASTWEQGDRTDSLSFAIGQTYAAGRGGATFDLNASRVTANTSFRPIIARNPAAPFFYPEDEPPEEDEIDSSIVLSIYGNTQGTYSIELMEREYPEDFYDTKPIFYDEDKDEEEGKPNRVNRASYDPFGWPTVTWNAYFVYPNASAIDTNRGYDGDSSTGNAEGFAPFRAVVSSFRNLPEPESVEGTLVALTGTSLSEFKEWTLEGIEDFIVYGESMSLANVYYGWAVSESVPADRYNVFGSTFDPRQGGYDGKVLIELGGSERLVNTPAAVQNRVFGGEAGIHSYDAAFSVIAYADAGDDRFPEQVVCTAYANRSQPPYLLYPETITKFDGTITPPARARVTYYRNGEQVLQAINPTKGQVDELKQTDGSYLVMTEALPSLDDEGNPVAPALPRMLKDFSSFIVDKKKPVVGFVPLYDVYGSTSNLVPAWGVYAFPGVTQMVATEPVFYFTGPSNIPMPEYAPNDMEDEGGEIVFARPRVASVWRPDGSPGSDPPQQGTHTLTLKYLAPFNIVDRMGNEPEFLFTQSWTIHPKLQEYREGVVAQIEEPGFQTREHYRPRLQSEPVTQLRMTFSRKINPDGVEDSHFRLFKSAGSAMEEVEDGLSVAPIGDGSLEWLITITAEQPERTFFMLTYDAGGGVVTDDIEVFEYPSAADLPSPGQYKAIYQVPAPSGGIEKYSWSPSGFVAMPGEYPLDPLGVPYEPEPCVIVSRVGWLMADMEGWHRRIDTRYTPVFAANSQWCTIGRIASVTETLDVDASKVESQITAKGSLYLGGDAGTIGTFSPGTTFDGFTPGVPSLESPENDASWWGLSTTIDPSPPGTISLCAAPKVAQRHASAIRCDGDITEWEITLESDTFDYSEYEYTNGSVASPSIASAFQDFAVLINDGQRQIDSSAFSAGPILVAKEPTTLTFIDNLNGDLMSQNVWSCVQDGSAATLDVAERCNRSNGHTCGDDDAKWYPIQIEAPARDVTVEEVEGWDVDPDFVHEPVTRDGNQVTPNKYMPGDKYPAGAPPSQAGKTIDWWADRLNPYDREEYDYVRGSASGIIRKLTSGTLEWIKTQGTVSASRAHKEFKALQTTTLGELVLNISLRVTVKATLDYEDRRNGEQFFGNANAGGTCFEGTWENFVRKILPTPVFGEILDEDTNDYITGFRWGAKVSARGTWEDAEHVDSRTLRHQFFADIEQSIVLTAEDEERLADGDELEFPAYGDFKWKIKAIVQDPENPTPSGPA